MHIMRSRFENIINALKAKKIDFVQRRVKLRNGDAAVLYIKELTDKSALSEQVIKPLVINKDNPAICPADIGSFIYAQELCVQSDDEEIEQELLCGMCVLVFSSYKEYIVINLKQVEKRSVPEPEATYTLRGPRDCFTENIETNISLVRYRIKDENLRIDTITVGRRTKTQVEVLYLSDVANDNCVNEVKKRINNIDIDGVLESGELQAYLLNKKSNLFPQTGIIERSDMACGALLEGKVIVLVEGSCWALVAPKTFGEFFWSGDDFYANKYMSTFLRIIRTIAFLISFAISSLYIAVVSFHNDILPSSYMIAIASSRSKVPFNALVEVLLIEFIIELIHESLVRVPKKIGTAIGVVGAIIIGQAAVSAGFFSPLLLIVVSTSMIASFVAPDYTMQSSFLLLKFCLIIATGTFGLFGFTIVITFILANLVSINTFGVSYMAPYTPFYKKDFFKTILYSKSLAENRPEFLDTKNKSRGKGNVNQK